ncbi:MAG: hypothetical protein ACRD88_19520, partial [Terriglobia bacterium]
GNVYQWDEGDDMERLPVEPDALFTLGFVAGRAAHFCYEADRGTMSGSDMLRKMRAYYHLIKKQQEHKAVFGVHPIRAVLIETTDEPRARKLMNLAEHPLVSGAAKRAGLFWFVISPLFTDCVSGLPGYLTRPEVILDRLWALPDLTLHTLCDNENKTHSQDSK